MAPKGKKVAPAPLATKTESSKAPKNPLFESTPKNFGIGQALQPKRNLTRFVKWPQYVRLQRQKKILNMRLKVPPAIAQFQNVLDKNTATQTSSCSTSTDLRLPLRRRTDWPRSCCHRWGQEGFRRFCQASCRQVRFEPRCFSYWEQEGQVGFDCQRRRPNWVGHLLASFVQKDGCPIRYCQG